MTPHDKTTGGEEMLKVCPFCGTNPIVCHGIDRGTQKPDPACGTIICDNDVCGVNPSVDYYNGFDQGKYAWNARTQSGDGGGIEGLDEAIINFDCRFVNSDSMQAWNRKRYRVFFIDEKDAEKVLEAARRYQRAQGGGK